MIVVGGVVGGVIIIGSIISESDYSEYSEHSDWSEAPPEVKYKDKIQEVQKKIDELDDKIKIVVSEVCCKYDIVMRKFPSIKDILNVRVETDGVHVDGMDEFKRLIKNIENELKIKILENIKKEIVPYVIELEKKKKSILTIIDRMEKIKLNINKGE